MHAKQESERDSERNMRKHHGAAKAPREQSTSPAGSGSYGGSEGKGSSSRTPSGRAVTSARRSEALGERSAGGSSAGGSTPRSRTLASGPSMGGSSSIYRRYSPSPKPNPKPNPSPSPNPNPNRVALPVAALSAPACGQERAAARVGARHGGGRVVQPLA